TVRTGSISTDNAAAAVKARTGPGSHASLFAEFANHSRMRVVRYGTPVAITGRITDPSGAPLAGARLEVSEFSHEPGANARDAGVVTSGSDGSWRYVAAVGSSRELTFGYRSGDGDAGLVDRTQVTLLVRAAAKLAVSRRRA